MEFKKRIEKLLIFCFIAAIFLPLLLSNKVGGQASYDENRTLAKFPSLFSQDGSVTLRGFRSSLENWINDNAFGRPLFIRLNAQINYDIFKVSPKADTLIGKDNWTYYYNNDVLKHYQKLDVPNQNDLASWSNEFKKLQGYLKSRNIDFFGTIIPDKATVYPENFPKSVLVAGKEDKTDALLNQMTQVDHLDFFTPKNNLIQAKSQATVYSKSFDYSHWNNYGAFIGYTSIVQHIKKYFPNVKALTFNDYNIAQTNKSGLYYNLVPISEPFYTFTPKSKTDVVEDNSFFDSFTDLNYIGRPDVVKKHFVNKDKSLPRVLLVGDSMSYDYLFPYLSESCSELTFLHMDEMGKAQEVINKAKPQLVIYESVERMFNEGEEQVKTFNDSVHASIPMDSSSLQSLKEVAPTAEQYGGMFLDSANGMKISEQGKIKVSKDVDSVDLVGWAADFKAVGTLKGIYVQCGDKLISGQYGIERTSVSSYYNNPNLKDTGFQFHLTKDDLQNNTLSQISFILVGYNGTYKFKPAVYQISYN